RELAGAWVEARPPERNAAAAAQEPSFGEDVSVARRGEEAHIEVEGGLAHSACGIVVGRSERATHPHAMSTSALITPPCTGAPTKCRRGSRTGTRRRTQPSPASSTCTSR